MNKDKYTQCSLKRITYERPGKEVIIRQVSWIPTKFAVLNSFIKLKQDGIWEDKWLITGIGATSDSPPDAHNAVKEHRKNTGDSLPK